MGPKLGHWRAGSVSDWRATAPARHFRTGLLQSPQESRRSPMSPTTATPITYGHDAALARFSVERAGA